MTELRCDCCHHFFQREWAFENHRCEEMKRMEFMKTPKGVAAFNYYKEWLRARGNGTPTEETFTHSRFFASFVRFITFSNRMLLPNKSAFIKYMVSLGMLPTNWCKDEVYINYIENLDKTYTPLMQAEETVKTLYELSSAFECKVNEIFDYLEAGDCIKLLKSRKLTPWVLLFSKKFHEFMAVNLSKEQRLLIQSIINPNIWRNKFTNRPTDVEKMKKVVSDLNL